MQSVRQKTFLLLLLLGISAFFFLPYRQTYVKDELSSISEYERMQSSKLYSPKWFQRIQKMDKDIIQPQLRRRFRSVFKEHGFEVRGRIALCIGSRLGGEVRALQDLGALAIGIDFNPGERNKHVLYGSATDLQFPSGVFDILYSNILDHIQDIDLFFREVSRVAKHGTLLLLDIDQNSPDRWSVRDLRGRVDELSALVQSNGWMLLTKKVIRNEKDKGKVALVFSNKL